MTKDWAYQEIDWKRAFAQNADQGSLKCPKCGEEYVHLIKVTLNLGGEVVVIGPGKEKAIIPGGPATGRGSSVWISFVCESGHCWREHYQFHKGFTYKQIEGIADSDLEGGLWRD